MLNPYDFAFRKIKKIVYYDATEEEKLDLILNTIGILSTKVNDKEWFYTHPSFNDKFYTDKAFKTSNKINMSNPWHSFFIALLGVTSLEEVKKEIYYLETYKGYKDWIVENVRKKRVVS